MNCGSAGVENQKEGRAVLRSVQTISSSILLLPPWDMLHLEKIRPEELGEKVRKEEGIDLKGCVLKEMIQWDCRVVGEEIRCFAVERLFRRCANGRTIEVTGLEKIGGEGR